MVFAHSIVGFTLLFGISGGEILILLLLVLILFGPSKIPEIARMLGRGINEVKKVQREINTEIHRYSSEIEKETSKMQSEIDDIKKQVAQNQESQDKVPQDKVPQNREPRPDPYEEALAKDPGKQPEGQDRADKIRESMNNPDVDLPQPDDGNLPQSDDQDLPQPEDGGQPQPDDEDLPQPEDEDLPYPYGRKKNRDSVD